MMYKKHSKRISKLKPPYNYKLNNDSFKYETIFCKFIIYFHIIINRFKRRWYPLNRAEIEMINQIFESCYEVDINENILIGDKYDMEYFLIDENINFNFDYILSNENCWSYNIKIKYENKKEVIIECSSIQAPIMGNGHYTFFRKENNRWVKKGTSYWIS